MVSVLSFYCFEFEHREATDLLTYMGGTLFIALSGIYFGIFIGCLTNDQNVAILIANLMVMFFTFGSGCFANTGSEANPLVTFSSWISPMKYSTEILMT